MEAEGTLYFGYGSNIWIDQMRRRCPRSKLVGIASLQGWKWIINIRGYANIIPSPDDVVYGLVYELSESDEAALDAYEGVPRSYVREIKSVQFTLRTGGSVNAQSTPNGLQALAIREALVYIDYKRTRESTPKKEYILRINRGIEDAVKEGIPYEYFQKYFRPFIPASTV